MEQNKNVNPNTVEEVKDYTDEQRTAIIDKANDQYLKMVKEGKYKDILEKFGQNGNYSLNNLLYMLSQNPDVTVAKGMNEWEKAGRSIKKGAKSMEIMAPTKEEYQVPVRDAEGNEMFDEEGVPLVENRERTVAFHPNYVFDIKDTEGGKYENYQIGGKVSEEDKRIILDGVKRALQTRRYRLTFTNGLEMAKGENYSVDTEKRTLKVRKNLNNVDTSLALIEGASKALCAYKTQNFEGRRGGNADAFESASIKCILAARYGLDASDIQFSNLPKFPDNEIMVLRENLSSVCTGTKVVMDRVSSAFARAEMAKAQAAAPSDIPSLTQLYDKANGTGKTAGAGDMEAF